MKKTTLLLVLTFVILITNSKNTFAQFGKKDKEKSENSTKETNNKNIERPAASGSGTIDSYVNTAFDSYDEMKKISTEIEFYKVSIKEIPDDGSGVTTETTVTNGKGEPVETKTALKQFGELLLRVMQQSDNIQKLVELQKPAGEALASISPFAKPKAAKSLSIGGEAQAFVVTEVKKQVQLLNQQITALKANKNN